MNKQHATNAIVVGLGLTLASCVEPLSAGDQPGVASRAFVDSTGPGWKSLGAADFVNVNCKPNTWTWKQGTAYCSGQPVGVIRSQKPFTNFELLLEWRHMKPAGNSGVFVWTPKASLTPLKPGQLPHGIEVQVLDPVKPSCLLVR